MGSEFAWMGMSQRKYWIRGEKFSAIAGIVLCLLGVIHKDLFLTGLLMILCAYGISLVTRMGDEYAIW